MTDIEWAMVHYDGNNEEPYADLVVDALRQKREVDVLAAEYGIDAKTMLTLAKSQIATAKANIELGEQLAASQARERAAAALIQRECRTCAHWDKSKGLPYNCKLGGCASLAMLEKWQWRGQGGESK